MQDYSGAVHMQEYLGAAQLRALVGTAAPAPTAGYKRPGSPPVGWNRDGYGVGIGGGECARPRLSAVKEEEEEDIEEMQAPLPVPMPVPARPETPPAVKIAQLASEFDSRVSGMGGVTALAMASKNSAKVLPAVRMPFGELSATYAKMFQVGQKEDDFRAVSATYSGSQRRNERLLAHKAGLGWM